MSAVQTLTVTKEESELRLDRWFKRRFPALGHGRLEKLLRTGQIRVDGRRAKASMRLAIGQRVRVPPLGITAPPPPRKPEIGAEDAAQLRRRILYKDEWVIALDKPAGLAVQGGTGTHRHLDAMLDALRFGAEERPKLVHRLDRDTSGVLVLARSAPAARSLAEAFRRKNAVKLYWAVTVGVPDRAAGVIDVPLAKLADPRGERVATDKEQGLRALTRWRVVDRVGRKAAWLALMPETGRTHQLRVHCSVLGTPILGDFKYGGKEAVIPGGQERPLLHLHARAIRMPHPHGGCLEIKAPLPQHMRETFTFLGFAGDIEGDADLAA
ncbi:MAG TPA: RluA family pseudouridine synthase [Alphaproteobacteria bacterium]|nr:RluA family pseudouridine synthase [Alphaproteobacteria bacterium]